MEVHVRDALAYPVVEAEEAPSCAQGVALSCGDPPPRRQEQACQLVVDLLQSLKMLPGDDERVAREHRAGVEEGDHLGLVQHPVGVDLTVADSVENAVLRHYAQGRAKLC